ncbi:MAG: hypothetical protein JKY52_14265 [Flavobacteriales bacterium]|nr:hypothetical protein [Flavobacteriales bacterium]
MFSVSCFTDLYGQEVAVTLSAPDSAISGEAFEIAVAIAKGGNTSFAKLQLEIPASFEVDSLEGDSARYMSDNSRAKYIWDRMPGKDTLLVKFKITTAPTYSGVKGLNGLFAYIDEEKKKEIIIPTTIIKIKQPATIAAVPLKRQITTASASQLVSPDKKTTAPSPEKKETKAVTKADVPVIQEKPKTIVTPAAAASIIEFRIQIVASASKINIDQLKKKYNISETIRAETHNGLWKYTVRSYATYGDAKKDLPLFRNQKGVAGAFITGYHNGQRIAVRSAINQTK